ncbi:MAG: CheB methylesterase domain-containing protein [Armatimonadota bacterium]|nr:CheB methylesterase domain-containing protein [Armatimonadota bacterium]
MQRSQEATEDISQRILAPKTVVVIGAATGGPAALAGIVPKLPRSFPAAIIIVQQMRPGFTRLLANYLSSPSGAIVEEAQNHQAIRPNQILMAPGNQGLIVTRTSMPDNPYAITLEDQSDSMAKARARIDAAMQSASEVFSSRTIGVLLTGMGSDGRDGMKAIRDQGGTTIAQDQDSSILFDMPKSAIDSGVVDEILPLWTIADRLVELVGDN